MNITPISQSKIFELNDVFNQFVNLFTLNKLPNKILLSGPEGSGKSTLAYHLINYIFSQNENDPYSLELHEINKNNKSFKLVQKNSHPNFHLIDLLDEKKNIEISQVRKMITYTNKSSFNNSFKFILIDNIENLNAYSANALLKVIEEPNPNVFFILIHNNKKKILDTLKSRCIIFKLNLTFNQSIKITNQLLNKNVFDLISTDLLNYYTTPGNYIKLINFSEENKVNLNDLSLSDFLLFLINQNFYKKNDFIKNNIFNYIELYFLKLLHRSINKNKINSFYTKFIQKINDTKKFNLDYESLLMEFKSKILNG
jgi:DNA polymerase-3 subunit delta'